MKLRPIALDTDIQAALSYRNQRERFVRGEIRPLEFLINPYAFGGGAPPATDPLWADVFALYHFEGTNGAVVAQDSSSARVPMKFFGNAQISTTTPLSGSSSLLLDGTGDYVQMAATPFWPTGTNNWTLEVDVAVTGTPNAYDVIIGRMNSGTNFWKLDMGLGGNQIRFTATTGGTTAAEYQATSAMTWTVGQRYKVAVERNGSTLRIYRDGVIVPTTTVTAIATNNLASMPTTPVTIGNDMLTGSRDIAARIDEVRYTASARYSGAYTPELTPFLEGAWKDAYWASYTKSLLHMDGANGSTTWVDSKGVVAWTANGGAAQSNVYAPSGASTSGRFTSASSQYLTGSSPATWNVTNQDFSIEVIWRPDSATTDSALFCNGAATISAGTDVGVGVFHFGAADAGKLRGFVYSGATQYYAASNVSVVAATVYRVGFERFNGVVSLYVDGVKQSLTGAVATNNANYNAAWVPKIGRYNTGATMHANGYMAEMRHTIGASRWGGFDYIPETVQFPNS